MTVLLFRDGANNISMRPDQGSDSRQVIETGVTHDVSRRRFFQLAGGIAGAGVVLSAASCRKTPADTFFVGRGDTGLLNYLYMVEHVMSAFHAQTNMVGSHYYGLTDSELQLIADLRDHQLAHKGLLKALLGNSAMGQIVVSLAPVTFADRTDTLNHAIFLEDIAAAAYNGVAQYFTDTSYVLLVAKMATVQARHAAYERNILAANTFSDSTIVNSNGFDRALTPQQVMAALAPYIQTKLDISTLPG